MAVALTLLAHTPALSIPGDALAHHLLGHSWCKQARDGMEDTLPFILSGSCSFNSHKG